MKIDRLYFNEQLVDLPDGFRLSTNLQIASLLNLSDRQVSFSDSFTIPKTERNIAIMDGYGIESSRSNVPYRINRVTYIRNGIQQFANENAIVRETNNGYVINIYFQNNVLFETIEGRTISELIPQSFNYDLTEANFINRVQNTSQPVQHIIANFGAQTDTTIITDYQIPSVRVSYLWNKIFADNGFTYLYRGRGQSNRFNPFVSKDFTDGFITLDKGLNDRVEVSEPERQIDAISNFTYDFSQYVGEGILGVPTFNIPFQVFAGIPLNVTNNTFQGITTLGINPSGDNIASYNILQFNDDNFYRIRFFGNVFGVTLQDVTLEMVVNGVPQEITDISNGQNEIDYDERFFFSGGTQIYFRYRIISENSSQTLALNQFINFEIDVDNQFKRINFAEYFQNFTQKDFIKAICNKFGLIFIQKGPRYEFITYKELLTPFARYSNLNAFEPRNFVFEDWSDKFVILIRRKPKLSNNWYQRNNLKYQYNDPEDTFANAQFQINNTTLEVEGDVLISPFNAPETSVFTLGQRRLKRMPLYELEDEGVKAKTSRPYLHNFTETQGQFQYKREGGELNTYTGTFRVADFRGLSYIELYNKWINGIEAVLNRTELVECEIALSEIDIVQIDWFKLKYIKQLGGFYYLSKIVNFTNDTTTKCELIRVEAVEQLGEFTDAFNEDFNI